MEKVKIDIFADYACPFVFNTYIWLRKIKNHYGGNLEINWRSFLLGIKDKENFNWKDSETLSSNRSLLSLIAGKAAKKQGDEVFERYHDKLLISRHRQTDRIHLNDKSTLIRLADECELNLEQFEIDLNNENIIDEVSNDHNEGLKIGVFGTPTFVFENGNSIYLKTFIPPEQDMIKSFEYFLLISKNCSFIGEMKRPQPPWPSGYNV
tara:strand:- start:16 stop:639 length:624 start_codon:yes stop_codon:yes gene_type:complete